MNRLSPQTMEKNQVHIDLEAAKQEFCRLVEVDFHSRQMLELLLHIWRDGKLSPDDAGWALWNICDQYALNRDAGVQHRYQSEFFELVKRSFPERAHWVVCDGTQALTLIHGGLIDFWWGCYQYANERAPRVLGNRTVRFESHRANAATCMQLGESDRAAAALEGMAELLEEDAMWQNMDFAHMTYMSLLVQFYGAAGQNDQLEKVVERLVSALDAWLQRVSDAPSSERREPLFGSWDYINADRPPSGVFVGTHNAACAFAKVARFFIAERLFRILLDRGRTLSDYGEALFLQSCWRNRGSREEINRMLSKSMKILPEYLIHVAPEMTDVVA